MNPSSSPFRNTLHKPTIELNTTSSALPNHTPTNSPAPVFEMKAIFPPRLFDSDDLLINQGEILILASEDSTSEIRYEWKVSDDRVEIYFTESSASIVSFSYISSFEITAMSYLVILCETTLQYSDIIGPRTF